MQIIPAIDLLAGHCVRLTGGEYSKQQTYDKNPADVARRFFDAGAKRLHVVDLDAARVGHVVNVNSIEAILKVAQEYEKCEIEFGGGLRDKESIHSILNKGIHYAILGTMAVEDSVFRDNMIAQFPQKIIIGMDVRAGKVSIEGWLKDSQTSKQDFIKSINRSPPAALIYTDIERDGMLNGSNIKATVAIAEEINCPVIASGGINSLHDIQQLNQHPNIDGVIIGKALYTGTVDLSAALEITA